MITSAPARSPNHHVIQVDARWSPAYPAKPKLPTPMVALKGAAAARLINAKRAIPPGVSKVLRPPDQRLIK